MQTIFRSLPNFLLTKSESFFKVCRAIVIIGASMDSNISRFYEKNWEERLAILKERCKLSEEELSLLKSLKPLDFDIANLMIENVIGVFALPLAIATHFKINGKDYLIPMAIEESSVVAAACKAAKLARAAGGFKAEATEPVMIGQIQIIADKPEHERIKECITKNKKRLLELANSKDQLLFSLGGGAKYIEFKSYDSFLVANLLVDVRDAMGANAVNTMCEALGKEIESLCDCKVGLQILSNLAVYRKAKAHAIFAKEVIGGQAVDAVIDAYRFAYADPFRACTHNKGIMNGIDAVAIACGNDFRALEAGAHCYAWFREKTYRPLSKYWKDSDGNLHAELEMPLAVGIVGGATRVNPLAKLCLKILGVKSAKELACVLASVGLAQNFAALYALATEGIQRGHMKLHAENIAVQAGAKRNEIKEVALRMIEMQSINEATAKEILKEIRKGA